MCDHLPLNPERQNELRRLHIYLTTLGDIQGDTEAEREERTKEILELFNYHKPELQSPEDQAFCAGILQQQDIGVEAFATEVRMKLSQLTDPAELHYLMARHNYDDGVWFPELLINHPCCDIKTARMVFWLLEPGYYAAEVGHPRHVASDHYNYDVAQLLMHIEAEARSGGFIDVLPDDFEDDETPVRIQNQWTNNLLWGVPESLYAPKK